MENLPIDLFTGKPVNPTEEPGFGKQIKNVLQLYALFFAAGREEEALGCLDKIQDLCNELEAIENLKP